jgi:hypothetical protein
MGEGIRKKETVETVMVCVVCSIFHQLKLVVNERELNYACSRLVATLTSRNNCRINHRLQPVD